MVGTGLIFIWNMVIKSAGAWASAILAGKCGSRRHFTTSSSKNVQGAETSYQMLEGHFAIGRECNLLH